MVNFPTRIPDCDSHSPALLHLFLFSRTSICYSDHFVVWVSIDFLSNSQWDAFFIAQLITILLLTGTVFVIIWEMFHGREAIFKLSASAAASEFREWIQVGIDVYIPHRKYQAKPHSSPWFSAACAAAIVHRNHFFHFYQQHKSSESKVKFSGPQLSSASDKT